MHLGINYPWGTKGVRPGEPIGIASLGTSYGWDLGDSPYGSPALWIDRLAGDLAFFDANGIGLVRWFVLGDGMSYGRASDFAGDQFNPPLIEVGGSRLDMQKIANDFTLVLERFEALEGRVKIVPCLVDGWHWAELGPIVGDFRKGHRGSVFQDAAHVSTFLTNALDPLLSLSEPYSDFIEAWDLINEPEALETNFGITAPQVDEFLLQGVSMINSRTVGGARRFRSTVGYQYFNSMVHPTRGSYAMGCNIHQFHYYGNVAHGVAGDMPRSPTIAPRPADLASDYGNVWVGEVTTRPDPIPTPPPPPLPPERGGSDYLRVSTFEKVRMCRSRNYETILLWSALRKPESRTRFYAEQAVVNGEGIPVTEAADFSLQQLDSDVARAIAYARRP